jgi:hypothetical protein
MPRRICMDTQSGSHSIFAATRAFVMRLDSEILYKPLTQVALELDKQKNGVWGELVGLGRSGHPLWCPVATMTRCVLYLRSQNAFPSALLHQYFEYNRWHCITTTMLTKTLHRSALTLGAASCIRSLRSSWAMALLCAFQ